MCPYRRGSTLWSMPGSSSSMNHPAETLLPRAVPTSILDRAVRSSWQKPTANAPRSSRSLSGTADRSRANGPLGRVASSLSASLRDSGSKARVCGICLDAPVAPHNAMVTSDDCMHRFCTDCLRKHGEAVVNSGKAHIRCPAVGCKQVWSTKMSENLLPSGIHLRLVQRQIEQTFPVSERVYCPFQDCSAMLLAPELQTQPSSSSHPHQTAVGGVECLACNRLFCLECRVPWHGELSCEEFQALPKDERSAGDIGLADLAKRKRWQRCQECGSMVELLSGCHHITCRCGNSFCYTCGDTWSIGHLCQN